MPVTLGVAQSPEYFQAMNSSGNPSEQNIMPGFGHGIQLGNASRPSSGKLCELHILVKMQKRRSLSRVSRQL